MPVSPPSLPSDVLSTTEQDATGFEHWTAHNTAATALDALATLSNANETAIAGHESRLDTAEADIDTSAATLVKVEAGIYYVGAATGSDQGAEIQALIDACHAAYTLGLHGGGIVQLGAGTYITTVALEVTDGVYLQGRGMGSTMIKLQDGSTGDDIIRTKDFAAQTLQNLGTVANGVHVNWGIRHLTVNGNKQNTTGTGSGIKVYGKRFILDWLSIIECRGNSLYSECGNVSFGGAARAEDGPFTTITNIFTYNSNDDAIVFRGPHDAYMDNIIIEGGAGDAITWESSGTYNGACDVGFVHSYGNVRGAVVSASPMKIGYLEVETCSEECLVVAAAQCQIQQVWAFFGGSGGADYAVRWSGSEGMCNNLKIRVDDALGGLYLDAPDNVFNNIQVIGGASTGIGLNLDDNRNLVRGRIEGMSGVGGIGLKTSEAIASGIRDCQVDLIIEDCATLVNYSATSARNLFRLSLNAAAGQTLFSGVAFGTDDHFDMTGVVAGSGLGNLHSLKRGTATVGGGGTVVVTHNVIQTPTVVNITPTSDPNGDFWVSAVGATTFTINGSAGTTFNWQASI